MTKALRLRSRWRRRSRWKMTRMWNGGIGRPSTVVGGVMGLEARKKTMMAAQNPETGERSASSRWSKR
jgi:hypothetical protein